MRFLSGKHGFELSSVFRKAVKMVKSLTRETKRLWEASVDLIMPEF